MDFGDVVAMAGGEASPAMIEKRLTAEGAAHLTGAIGALGAITQGMIQNLPSPNEIRLVITASTSPQCRSRRLDARTSVVLVPLGALARLQVLTRRLLWHLAQDAPEVAVFGSTLDEPDPAWELAPDLIPLFGEDATQDDSQYWEALARFDSRTPTDEARVALANNFLDTGFLFLALHEVIHIAARHDRVLELARAEDARIPRHLGLPQLRRGMEIQADVVAAENLARFLALDPAMAPRMDEDPEIEIYKTSFALAALFGMYDTHRKSISQYDSGAYLHPILRYEFADEATRTVLGDLRPDLHEAIEPYGMAGFRDCSSAYSAMEWHCMGGMYGGPPPGSSFSTRRYLPITTLKYGGSAALRPLMIEENRLFQEVADVSLEIAFGADQ